MSRTALVLVLLSLLTSALARVEFGVQEFNAANFRDAERLGELCAAPAAASFWCDSQDADLQIVTSKNADVVFSDTGEMVALFSKQQKGQDYGGNYNLENAQNLIPPAMPIPGGTVLIDGERGEPQNASLTWQPQQDEFGDILIGSATYQQGDYEVAKRVTVRSYEHTMTYQVTVTRADGAEATEPVAVQLALPGIGQQDNPAVKIGQADTFSLNPVTQSVPNPSYVSIQTNNRNTGSALVMRPHGDAQTLTGARLEQRQVAMGTTLAPDADEATFTTDLYAGPNELIRYHQEGYTDLAGFFNPNIFGRLSLGIILVLEFIHSVVGSWGVAIILLTLLFRVLVWPLITTQTRSMAGMQQIQPKLQALQKKYKDNREKLTQETMKLYQEAGVNPAGGCLPMILQMPLFIILWRVFVNYEFNQGFLWIPDLGLADPFFILPILYIGVMVANTFVSAKGNMKTLRQQLMFSLVFVFFIFNFPAAVTLYWIVSMLFQVGQQHLIQRTMPAPAPA